MQQEWQPIETAPKDGRIFLAYFGPYLQFVAWTGLEPKKTLKREGPWYRKRWIEEIVEAEHGFSVLLSMRGGGYGVHGNFAPFTPTCWMPLPDPLARKENDVLLS